MQHSTIKKSALLAGALALVLLGSWEVYWRSKGYVPTFNDDKALWAARRPAAHLPREKATVFIGSSRNKFDVDLPEWRRLTGEEPVQLSLVGTSPLLLLKDLAEDTLFRGKLIIDVTEVIFFSRNPAFQQSAKEATAYHKKQTLAEGWSAQVNFLLESRLSFLEERRFALNTLLNDLEIPNRPGVFSMPPFPKGFEWTTFDRQTFMSKGFLSNPHDLQKQTRIWEMLILGDPTPPTRGQELLQMLEGIKQDIDRIRARGGQVIFLRTPSSGPMAIGEEKAYPRKEYWQRLLSHTSTDGIHYLDYPETAGLICPEWSHLAPEDAVRYTRYLVSQLQAKGWFGTKPPAGNH